MLAMICLREPGLIDSTSLLRCYSHYSQTACGLYGKVKSLSKYEALLFHQRRAFIHRQPQSLPCHFVLLCQAQILSLHVPPHRDLKSFICLHTVTTYFQLSCRLPLFPPQVHWCCDYLISIFCIFKENKILVYRGQQCMQHGFLPVV